MKVEITEEMMTALAVGMAELGNSDRWTEFVSDGEFEDTHQGMDEWREIIKEYYSKSDSHEDRK